jgi:hypothetical protein
VKNKGPFYIGSCDVVAFRAAKHRGDGLELEDIIVSGGAKTVTIEEQVLEKLRGLPPETQKEVLDFVSRLKERRRTAPRRSLLGLWTGLNIEITEEDIAEARREMWGKFPRDIS